MTTLDITFNPPIGDSIQLKTSLSSQKVLLHFTAELTAHDRDKLIQDRARIQLWSDLPHSGQSLSDGAWDALDLTYQALATETSPKISLGSAYPSPSEEKVTLFLELLAPLDANRPYSFTYRIIYPSGHIQWLGAFGQNGSLSFERSDYDLHNFGLHSWTFDKSRMAYVYEIKEPVGTLIAARVRDVCNYRVRAIGPTSFVSDLKEAAILFFIPLSQPESAITLLPTYVFSASPGSSLTLSADGQIIVSGSGTLLFQANEGYFEPSAFIRQILSHAQLNSWNALAWDASLKAVILTTQKGTVPIKAVTIPLWHSKRLIRPIHLKTTTLCDLLESTEFSVFSPDDMRIRLFTVDPAAEKPMQFDTAGNALVMSPIYTLKSYQATIPKTATIWKAAILSPYQVQDSLPVDDSGILPTPPPSPHLQPIARISQEYPLCDTAMSSVPSLPLETCTSLQRPMNGNDEPEILSSPTPPMNPDTNASGALQNRKRSNWLWLFPQRMLGISRSLFYTMFFIYRLLWEPRTFGLFRRGNTNTTGNDQPQSQVSTAPEDDDLSSLDDEDSDVPDDSGDRSESVVKIPETKALLEGNTETQTTETQPSQSDAEIPEAITENGVSGVSPALDNTKGDVYYVQGEPSDSGSKETMTIALLCTTHKDRESSTALEDVTTILNAPSDINKSEIMERCVQFLDGSEPECVVSRCNVDVFHHGRVPPGMQPQVESGCSCCLLQYRLDCDSSDLEKSERTIRISPPSVGL